MSAASTKGMLSILCAAVLAGLVFLLGLRWGLLLGINLAAFILYGIDKRRACCNGQRIPEMTLLAVAAVGGVPGSLAGQLLFHHKTSKASFQRIFGAVALFQLIVIVFLP